MSDALTKKAPHLLGSFFESAYGATLIPAFNVPTIVAFAKRLNTNFDALCFQFAFFILGSPRTVFYGIALLCGVLSRNFRMINLLVFAAYLFTSNYFMVSSLMLTNTYHRMLNVN